MPENAAHATVAGQKTFGGSAGASVLVERVKMAGDGFSETQFSLGRVTSGIFAPIVRNWRVLLGFAAAAQVLGLVVGMLAMRVFPAALDMGAGKAAPMTMVWVSSAFSLLLFCFKQSGLMRAILDGDAGRSVDLMHCVNAGILGMLPFLGLTVLWGLGLGLGYMVLVIPSLILVSMWAVCAPVLAGENVGIFEAFGRSRTLTRGNRFVIFVALLLFGIVHFGIMYGVALGPILTIGPEIYLKYWWIVMPLNAIIGVFLSLFLAGFLTSLYRETRLVNEGSDPDGLAEVFA
jgi:hypothetical protein